MPRSVLIEELHLSLFVPNSISESEVLTIRQDLWGRRFQARLGRTIRSALRQFPSMRCLRLTLSR
jgi:hypothetical protein